MFKQYKDTVNFKILMNKKIYSYIQEKYRLILFSKKHNKKSNFFFDKFKNYYYNHTRSLIIINNIKLYVKVYYE